METFSFLVYLFIFYYFLIYSLFAPMDKCHQRIPFQKKKTNSLNLVLKTLLCSSPGHLETCRHEKVF